MNTVKLILIILSIIMIGCKNEQSINPSDSITNEGYQLEEVQSPFFIEGFSTENTEKMLELYWKNVDGLLFHYHEDCPCENNNLQTFDEDFGGFWIDFDNKIFYQYVPDNKFRIVKIIYNWENDTSYIENYDCIYDYSNNTIFGECYLTNDPQLEFKAIKTYFTDNLSLDYSNEK